MLREKLAARLDSVLLCAVFTGSGDACARAFDAQSGALQRVFRGHSFVINCLQVGASLPSSGAAGTCWGMRGLGPGPGHPGEAKQRPSSCGWILPGGLPCGWGCPEADSRPARLQVHGQVLYTVSHDGTLRLWDMRGLRAPPPTPRRPAAKRSLSRLFSNKVACAADAPLQAA